MATSGEASANWLTNCDKCETAKEETWIWEKLYGLENTVHFRLCQRYFVGRILWEGVQGVRGRWEIEAVLQPTEFSILRAIWSERFWRLRDALVVVVGWIGVVSGSGERTVYLPELPALPRLLSWQNHLGKVGNHCPNISDIEYEIQTKKIFCKFCTTLTFIMYKACIHTFTSSKG